MEIRVENFALKFFKNNMLLVVLVVIAVVAMLFVPGFAKIENLLGILRAMAITGVIAFGMTMVIICGEIDLSVGSAIGFSSVVSISVAKTIANSGAMPLEQSIIIGMIAAILLNGGIGFFNGFLRAKFQMPSFIVTLVMLNVLYGLAAIISKGFPITDVPAWHSFIGAGVVFGRIPAPAIWLLIVFAIAFYVMENTRFGREVYAVGGNPESSRLSGIDVTRIKISVMVIVQMLAAFAGIILSSQVHSGSSQFGRGYEMDVIAAVIIGGTSLFGGIGKITGTLQGILLLGILMNCMTLLGMDDYVKYVVRGSVILLAVLLNTLQQQRGKKI